MLLTNILKILGRGETSNISNIAFKLNETEDTIRVAIDHLCTLGYCKKIEPASHSLTCSVKCSRTCATTATGNFTFWEMTSKGQQYLGRI